VARADGPVGRASAEVGAYQDSVAVSVLTPSVTARVEDATAGWGAQARYLVDVISAASPDVVATASPRWSEVRHAGTIGGRYRRGQSAVAANATTSYTPDYLALAGNAQLSRDLDDRNLTLTAGYGYGHDVIGRAGTSLSVFSRELDYHVISAGASRVVNPSLVVGVFADVIVERGDQSKPYRYVPVFAPEAASQVGRGAPAASVSALRIQARPIEQLPLARERASLTGRVAWRLAGSTVRVEERVYGDTWGLRASTTDVRWLFDAGPRVILWPHLRVHVQDGVGFWRRAYTGTAHDLPALRTGDRELGPLTNLGAGGGLRVALGGPGRVEDWVLTTTLDGVWTSFADAIYVKERLAGILATSLEVAF
jgi:hypothetical protein